MHGFTSSSLLLLLVAGAGLSSAAPIGIALPQAAAISAVSEAAQVQAAASSSPATAAAALPASSAVTVAPVTTASAASSAPAATTASSAASAPVSSAPAPSKPATAPASTAAPAPAPSLCPGVVEWTGAVYLDNDDGTVDTRMTMKTACPPGAKGIKLTIMDTTTCAPLTSTSHNLGFATLEANVYDDNKTISEGRSDDGTAVTLSCTDKDSISIMGIFHGPKRVMTDALTFTAPKVETV
jgi:cell wall-associated NlpC family hydrolase